MTSANASAGPNNLFDGPLCAASYDLFAAAALGWGPLSGDVQFYIDCAKSYGSPVLELGVGTGRVALQVAQNGFEVVELDASAEMLAVAERALSKVSDACRQRVRFVKADIMDFTLDGLFPLALVPARTFHHLTTPLAQRAALEL